MLGYGNYNHIDWNTTNVKVYYKIALFMFDILCFVFRMIFCLL